MDDIFNKRKAIEDMANLNDDIIDRAQNTSLQDNTEEEVIESEFDPQAEYVKAISEYKDRLNKPEEELTWKDRLPDMLAAAHNIINYSKGNTLPNIEMGYADKVLKNRQNKKKKDLSGLEKLQAMHQKYQDMQRKSSQDKRGQDKFDWQKSRAESQDKFRDEQYEGKKSSQELSDALLRKKLEQSGQLTPYQQQLLEQKGLDRELKKELQIEKLKGKNKNKIYQTRSGLVELDDEGKVKELYKDPYMQDTADTRKKSLGLRQDKFSDKKAQKQQDDAAKAIDSLRKTETWKSAEKSISNIPEIEVLLDDAYNKGGQSLAMLGPRVAKGIAGEVGVLTEQDVTRYVENPELVGGMLDTLTKLKSGRITETSYENLKRLLDISKRTAREKLDTAIDREAILLSRREKMPFEDAKYLLDETYKTSPIESVKEKNETVKVGEKEYKVGSNVSIKGKLYRIKDTKGNIEEIK